jgi:hypothetical protein
MKSHVLALAALAAIGFSGAAFAAEVTKPTPMTDEQMDKVAAGFGFVEVPEAAFVHGFLVNQIGDPGIKARERAAQPVLRSP